MKRAIVAIDLPEVAPGSPPTPVPELTWIDPAELVVDEVYQRDLSDRSRKLIRRIVENFDWRRFKPPIVTWTEDGLEVIDGQHSATAAVCHPGIDKIPVVVVDAAEQQDRASAFLGHNRDRITVTAAQMQVAAVAAGDKDALAVESACRLANVRLLRVPPSSGKYQPGETIAAAQIGQLVRKHGIHKAAEVLTVLALAGFAPIHGNHIKAIETILIDEQNPIAPEDLTRAVMAHGAGPAEKEAKLFAATHNVPHWRGLVAVWIQATKKRRPTAPKVPDSAARKSPNPGQESVSGQTVARVIPKPTGTKEITSQGGPATHAKTASVQGGAIAPDPRPARSGYVPGPLIRRCANCDQSYVGGLRSSMCADCAYGTGGAS